MGEVIEMQAIKIQNMKDVFLAVGIAAFLFVGDLALRAMTAP